MNKKSKYLGSITYTGKRTNKFIKILKQYNINTGSKNDLSLLTQMNNKLEITDKNNFNGVYKLNCKQCNMTQEKLEKDSQPNLKNMKHHND